MFYSKCGNPLSDNAKFCGALLAVILTAVLTFVFEVKASDKGIQSVPIYETEVVYDDEYTYYLSEQETGDKAYIMRIGNQSDAKPEIFYEADQIKGDGWGQYPLGALFLWDDKICFLEVTNASETTAEYGLSWVSKDGKESGTLASYEQLLPWGNKSLMSACFYDHYLILGDQQYSYRLDLNTGESCMLNDVLNIKKYVRFVAYDNGNYYYIVPDMENNGIGGTLYRKAEDSEEEQICFLPTLDIANIEDYSSFIPKGDYLYFADESSVFRIHMKTGSMEEIAFHDGAYNRFALCDTGLYYFKDMSLHLLNLETLEETVFDLPESVGQNPEMIYAGQDDVCWFKQWVDSFDYCCFRPNESTGSFVFLNGSIREDESTQDASADNQEAAFSTDDYEGDWVWKRENSDMEASLRLEATDASTFSGNLSFYRLFSEQLTITMSGNTGTVTSEFGNFNGTARFESGSLYLCFEDQVVYQNNTISEMFGTTEFYFVPVS